MPILAPQVDCYPDDLLTNDRVDDPAQQWHVLYTRPRQEKALARDLLRLEIPFYLPLVKQIHVIRGKEVPSHLPVFAGYVFLFGDQEQRARSLTTQRVAQCVAVKEQARLSADLRKVQRLVTSGAPLTIERLISPGRNVRIKSGSLRGMDGIVIQRRGQTRLLVLVDFLQQGASIEIEEHRLEPLN